MSLKETLQRFDIRYDQYNPKNDNGEIAIWNGCDYDDLKQFIEEEIKKALYEITPNKINYCNNASKESINILDGHNSCVDDIKINIHKYLTT